MMKKLKSGDPKLIVPTVVIAFLFLFPLMKPSIYFLSFLFTLFTYIALSESWNLIGGYAGYLSFGHVAFFGVGAYTTALLLIHFGLSPFYTCFLGGILAAILAVIFGYPCLRLRGGYFAIASFCMALAMPVITLNLDITGAATGLWMSMLPFNILTNRMIFYEVMLTIALIVVLVVRHIEGTKFGLGLKAIGEDEETAEIVGVNTTKLKMTAFVASAFVAGIVGGIYAYYRTYIHPSIVFDVFMTLIIVYMAFFGGCKSWLGPVIGAAVITIVNEALTAFLGMPGELARIVFGLTLMLVIIFMPEGIVFFIRKRRAPKKSGFASQPEV
jgi:branched-chain amino acid transport system permease protein